ncbi:MAG: hypothetical protein Q8P01_00725 [bacterium]|nr:hypothetical protein [bacterium]
MFLDRLLFGHKCATTFKILVALNILSDIDIGEAGEIAGKIFYLPPQLLNGLRCGMSGFLFFAI